MSSIVTQTAAGRGLLALALVVLSGGLEASTVRRLTLDEMAVQADQILTGQVVGIASQVNARRTGIYTFVTIEVEEYLKGGRRNLFTLRFLGGEAEGYRLVVAGSPVFHLGEEVLVFSDGGAGRIPTVLGMAAGKFTVDRDPGTGDRVLRRSLAGLEFREPEGQHPHGDPLSPGAALSRGPVSLGEVRRAVEEALAQ